MAGEQGLDIKETKYAFSLIFIDLLRFYAKED